MTSRSRSVLLAGALLGIATACSEDVADKPIAAFQTELLDFAFKAATAIPIDPHIKSRSHAQDLVVAACFELDQPRRALGYVQQIDNWRRGTGYADFAFYCAQHGATAEVQHYLDLASEVSQSPECESPQDWRRDRIRVKIARTYVWLGQAEKAAPFEADVVSSEMGKVDAVRALLVRPDAFDEQVATLDRVIATESFEQVQNALETCAQLFNRFYGDRARRALLEEKIKTSWSKSKLPISVRLDVLMELTGFALDHEDPAKALELVQETQRMIDECRWIPENRIPFMARLAGLRFRAGEREKARADVDAALAMYEAERDKIVDIYRAGVLRPIAEVYQSMGDRASALTVYRRAVEEGVANPNSRPRAEDVSATCCSMAVHGVEPDAGLRARLLQIQGTLGQPW